MVGLPGGPINKKNSRDQTVTSQPKYGRLNSKELGKGHHTGHTEMHHDGHFELHHGGNSHPGQHSGGVLHGLFHNQDHSSGAVMGGKGHEHMPVFEKHFVEAHQHNLETRAQEHEKHGHHIHHHHSNAGQQGSNLVRSASGTSNSGGFLNKLTRRSGSRLGHDADGASPNSGTTINPDGTPAQVPGLDNGPTHNISSSSFSKGLFGGGLAGGDSSQDSAGSGKKRNSFPMNPPTVFASTPSGGGQSGTMNSKQNRLSKTSEISADREMDGTSPSVFSSNKLQGSGTSSNQLTTPNIPKLKIGASNDSIKHRNSNNSTGFPASPTDGSSNSKDRSAAGLKFDNSGDPTNKGNSGPGPGDNNVNKPEKEAFVQCHEQLVNHVPLSDAEMNVAKALNKVMREEAEAPSDPKERLAGKKVRAGVDRDSTELVVTNLPDMPSGESGFGYFQMVDALTEGLPRCLLVRGTQSEVITAFT